MMNAIQHYLPWLLSVITIYMTVLAGNKSKHAWLFGLGNQGLWLVWIIATGAWGLIPMNIALWVVYARNHLKWQKGAIGVVQSRDDGVRECIALLENDAADFGEISKRETGNTLSNAKDTILDACDRLRTLITEPQP